MKHILRRGVLGLALGGALFAQPVVKQQGFVPFSDAPIYYRSEKLDDPVALALMRAVKAAFDPHGILGPERVLGIPIGVPVSPS